MASTEFHHRIQIKGASGPLTDDDVLTKKDLDELLGPGAGEAGATGATGVSGATGIGATGPRGDPGSTGPTGPAGASGVTGATGASGVTGLVGVTGATGEGSTGASGQPGVSGQVGATGATGATGASGHDGASGLSGLPGASGAQGTTGVTGATGTSLSLKGSVDTHANLPTSGVTQGDLWITEDDGEGWVSDGVGGWGPVGRIQGPVGHPGTTGATGPSGIGVTGATGPTGVGVTGATGASGETGAQGITGATGASGEGASGLQGTTGATGASGASGLPGASGASGEAGASGATGIGASGEVGATGATGISGASGLPGTTGVSGQEGAVGATGPTGPPLQGATGTTGATGASGEAGATGISGASGETGASGVSGETGASGGTGLVGATGSTGASGTVGATGPSGTVGATGVSGASGASGGTGEAGASGGTGLVGATGPSGSVGATGSTGISGGVGATGVSGTVGATGPSGASGGTGGVGATGPSGSVGATGVSGVSGGTGGVGASGGTGGVGASGVSGGVGATGPSGGVGASGASGGTGGTGGVGGVGATGASGTVGATGASGASGGTGGVGSTGASGTVGATGITGTVGSTGATGISGTQGVTGVSGTSTVGATGVTGVSGVGTVGATGATGVTGTVGATGVTGTVGATGVSGTGGGGAGIRFGSRRMPLVYRCPVTPFGSNAVLGAVYMNGRDNNRIYYVLNNSSTIGRGSWATGNDPRMVIGEFGTVHNPVSFTSGFAGAWANGSQGSRTAGQGGVAQQIPSGSWSDFDALIFPTAYIAGPMTGTRWVLWCHQKTGAGYTAAQDTQFTLRIIGVWGLPNQAITHLWAGRRGRLNTLHVICENKLYRAGVFPASHTQTEQGSDGVRIEAKQVDYQSFWVNHAYSTSNVTFSQITPAMASNTLPTTMTRLHVNNYGQILVWGTSHPNRLTYFNGVSWIQLTLPFSIPTATSQNTFFVSGIGVIRAYNPANGAVYECTNKTSTATSAWTLKYYTSTNFLMLEGFEGDNHTYPSFIPRGGASSVFRHETWRGGVDGNGNCFYAPGIGTGTGSDGVTATVNWPTEVRCSNRKDIIPLTTAAQGYVYAYGTMETQGIALGGPAIVAVTSLQGIAMPPQLVAPAMGRFQTPPHSGLTGTVRDYHTRQLITTMVGSGMFDVY